MTGREKSFVYIIDDDIGFLKAISFMLQMEGYQTKSYNSSELFLKDLTGEETGCILLDVRMPHLSGLQVQRKLKERGCKVPIIFLTAHGDIEMAVDAMEQGALTFLQKPMDDEKLLRAINRAMKAECDAKKESHAPNLSLLTVRENQILQFIRNKKTNRCISLELDISERTVESHRASIYKKLGVSSASELFLMFEELTVADKSE